MNAEQVVIDIIANDKTSQVFANINNALNSLSNIKLSPKIQDTLNGLVDNFKNKTEGSPIKVGSEIKPISPQALDEFVKNTNTQLNKSNIDIGKSISTTVGNTKLVPGKMADAFDLRTNTLSNLDYANNTLQDVNKSTLTLGNSSRLLNSEFYSMGKSVNSSLSKINDSLNLTSNSTSNSFGNFTVNPSVTSSVSSSAFSSSSAYEEKLNNINNKIVDVNKNTKEFNKTSTNTWRNNNNALRTSVSSFHNMNTMLSATASQFGVVGSAIAGVFGANGLSGMVEKMWSQATQRQTNMIYLMRRRGVKEASELYNEITDIVMELPGDDTFLTTILNQSAGMDKNLSVDKLRDLGSAITDYYIASKGKGELSNQIERDLRSYIYTGNTLGLRNSLLASEIDLLKNKNSVEERSVALQKALQNTGFAGMSGYESATNALEELRGHFQKAFADIGSVIITVTQPILKLYNTIDTLFGSRISRGIILVSMAVIGFTSALAMMGFMIPLITRPFEAFGHGMTIMRNFNNVVSASSSRFVGLKYVMLEAMGIENAYEISVLNSASATGLFSEEVLVNAYAKVNNIEVTEGLTLANIGQTESELLNNEAILQNAIMQHFNCDETTASTIATQYNTLANMESTYGLGGNSLAEIFNAQVTKLNTGSKVENEVATNTNTGSIITNGLAQLKLVGVQLMVIGVGILHTTGLMSEAMASKLLTLSVVEENEALMTQSVELGFNIGQRLLSVRTKISETFATLSETKAEEYNTRANLGNALSKIKNSLQNIYNTATEYLGAIASFISASAKDNETRATIMGTVSKYAHAIANLFLAGTNAILTSSMFPIIAVIVLIVGAVYLLIKGIELLGQAFGWWKDIGGMFKAISDGINRIWNAFMNSAPIRGILQYFGDFFATIRDFITGIGKILGNIFNFGDTGSFDIVQTIINLFGKLGDIIMWVWNLFDDWSNSPLGIVTWLSPLGILIFHLDEIGSLIEDVMDAWNRFAQSSEFQALSDSFNEVFTAIKEPFEEIWEAISELMDAFGEVFGSEDPVGSGTEERINFLVEAFKILATIIRVTIIPPLRAIALIIKVILIPIRLVISAITQIIRLVSNVGAVAGRVIDYIFKMINLVLTPIRFVLDLATGIWNTIVSIGDAIRKIPILSNLLGGDEENKDKTINENQNKILETSKQAVQNANIDPVKKQAMLDALNKENLTSTNVNNVKNMGQTYNNQNNQRQVVINQNFSEGAMPIDARNMTRKEARKMFIGAFGYKKAMGSRGILR